MVDGEDKLIEMAIRGEASAFGSLYDHYQPKIYRFVLIKVGRREEAEDLTHQVFLSAWQHIKEYQPLGFPFSSWLYQIARNRVVDHYRTEKKQTSLEEVDRGGLRDQVDQNAALDQSLEIGRVRLAIQKLKPEHQDVVIMRFIEELSLKEIAAALDKSEGAVKLIQHRAIKQLRDLLKQK